MKTHFRSSKIHIMPFLSCWCECRYNYNWVKTEEKIIGKSGNIDAITVFVVFDYLWFFVVVIQFKKIAVT